MIQEGTDEARHIEDVYSSEKLHWYRLLGFVDIYHSPLYIGLLCLLSLNLLFCTYKRLHRDWRQKNSQEQHDIPRDLFRFPNAVSIPIRENDVSQWIPALLEKQGFHTQKIAHEQWMGKRGTLNRYGFYLAHAGILIILGGSFVSSIYSIEGMMWLIPGESKNKFDSVRHEDIPLGFSVRCDDFSIETYDTGMPREYRSELTITPDNGQPITQELLVNHPIAIDGYRLYQSSYQQTGLERIMLTVLFGETSSQSIWMTVPGSSSITDPAGKSMTIDTLQFEPDFIFDENMKATSRSDALNNPALRIQVTREGMEPARPQWLFVKFPNHHGTTSVEDYTIQISDIKTGFATGLEIVRDPGSPLIWLGSVIMIAGFMVSFFIFPEKVWVSVMAEGASRQVIIAGISPRNDGGLKERLAAIGTSLNRKMDA